MPAGSVNSQAQALPVGCGALLSRTNSFAGASFHNLYGQQCAGTENYALGMSRMPLHSDPQINLDQFQRLLDQREQLTLQTRNQSVAPAAGSAEIAVHNIMFQLPSQRRLLVK